MPRRTRAAASIFVLLACALVSATGAHAATPRIVGGTKPSNTLYSTQLKSTVALISMDARSQYDGQFCGGTLIDAQHVLTAAHCIVETEPVTYRWAPSSFGVLTGTPNLNGSSLAADQLVPVAAYFVHPFFNLDTFRWDAAVLRLARPVTDAPVLAMLSPEESEALRIGETEVPARAAGWGDSDPDTDGCCFPASLDTLGTSIHTADACTTNLADSPTWRFDPEYQLCSGALRRDTCQGDSGGPLIVQVAGTPRLAGIVSHGVGCGEGFYGIYTGVSHLRPWIASIPGVVDGDQRGAAHGPDDSAAPTATGTAVDYDTVRVTVTPAAAGPATTKWTLWLRHGPAPSATDEFLGTFRGTTFTVDVPGRRTAVPFQLLVRGVSGNGESPAGLFKAGPVIDRVLPSRPGRVVASRSGTRLTVSWRASVDRQSGLAGYEVQRRVGGRWLGIQRVHAPGTRLVTSSRAGTVRVRAIDWADNASAWSPSIRF